MFFIILFLVTAQSVWGEDNCTAEYSCASCTEVRICKNTTSGYQEAYRFSCPASSPYCDVTGSCDALPSLECAPQDSYPCLQDGVFPNPSNCQQYHVCQNGTSYSYTCPVFYNFDSTQATCVEGVGCYTISCIGKTGTKVPYHDPAYYAYCLNNAAIFVERCPGAFQLNTDSQKCEPACQAVGDKIPDPSDCASYFYCSKEPYAYDYTVTSEQCPKEYGFDPRYLRCVPLNFLPSCSADQTTLY